MGGVDIVAVGVPVLIGPAQGWNFWPLVGIPVALVVAFRWLRLPRRLWVLIGTVVTGLLAADAVSTWGVMPVVAATAASVGAIAVILRRLRHA